MHKLITIYVHDETEKRFNYGEVHEHLQEYLEDSWLIKNMVPVGTQAGGGEAYNRGTRGWLAVLMEKTI